MKMHPRLLTVAALVASLHGVSAADVTGRITLKGAPPPERVLPLDPQCGKLHTDKKPTTRFFVVGKDGGLADVFVHVIDGLTGKTFQPPAQPAVIDQVGCEYVPYVLGAQTGQTIKVKNSDPVLHNVHPTPTVAGNKETNRAQLPKGPDLDHLFEKPEIFLRFKCDVHPWMFSYVGLVDHPFHATTDEKGNFKIANLPPGEYVIEAYHRKAGKQTQKIKVGQDNQKVDFSFKLAE